MWLKDLISILYPEILVLTALIIATILSTSKIKDIIWLPTVIFLSVGSWHIIKNQLHLKEPIKILQGAFILDDLSIFFKLLILIVSILLILGSIKYSEGFTHKSEFIILLLGSILGILFLLSANDLITLFVALETLGLSSVMLAGYSKYDTRSNEASIKYLLTSASASAIFLFGLSILYGLTGETQFYEIKYKLSLLELNEPIIALTLLLILGGLAFKLAACPFHMWSPDVYEGAPTPVTAFLSVASKIAGFVISLRLLYNLFDFASNVWQGVIIIISILSMTIGNAVALSEVLNKASIKRLMAYSSIAQIGYILIGLALNTYESVTSSIFYLIIYSFMNLGAFLCIIAFGNEANSDSIKDYSGLVKKRPLLALAFTICLFNLAGLPVPPAGFIAKFILFQASFEAGKIGILLGSIGLLTTIISIYYYSYIVKTMIVDEASGAVLKIDSNPEALGSSNKLNSAIAVSVCAIFLLSLLSYPILNISKLSTESISPKNSVVSYKK